MNFLSYKKYALYVVFLATIFFPLFNSTLQIVKDIPSSENRKPADKPKFDLQLLDPFPAKYEAYYNDQFTLRARLVKLFNTISIKVFQKSPFPDKLIIGKKGWLFMGGNEIESYTQTTPLTPSELENIKKEMEYRKSYLAERNCKFYLLIAPEKSVIYDELMPNNIFRASNKGYGEILTDYLKNSSVNIINMYDIFRERKNEMLYFKTDNHWNQLGAFLATNEFLKQVNKDFKEINPLPLSEFDIKKQTVHYGNILLMLSDTNLFIDERIYIIKKKGFLAKNVNPVGYPCVPGFPYCYDYEKDKEIRDSKAPKLLIISDSFGEDVFPFVAEHFSRSVKIFDSWQYKLNEEIVKKEKPDIVLLIMLEANIKNMLPYLSSEKKQ